MSWPKPVPGQVIRYSYLWRGEALKGREEGLKDRPCAIVFAVEDSGDRPLVVVVLLTHTPPVQSSTAIEIPFQIKKRLGLDEDRSWIILNESNAFRWPGPDLRPAINGNLDSIIFGMLPPKLFETLLARYIDIETQSRSARVLRTK